VGANTVTLRFWTENDQSRYEVLTAEGELHVKQFPFGKSRHI
jgi:hypothetical protein